MKHASNSIINSHIEVKFRTGIAHGKAIPQSKSNFEIYTDVIDNDVMLLKNECFPRKALSFKSLYLCMKHGKNW